ncbi:MAG: hypothetical protein A2Y15_09830 [Clostridiales bacterium GWF2_36_10]|nr:MAG: hypothetical protein A2Y15_09830 [Clostridiales bacterium GWF2_36_10]HAN20196.1 hypothetical protein [Clostridiales bacterium]
MEQLREIITESEEKRFKTSVFGFDKKEIIEHIAALEQNLKSSIFNYEKKLSEQSNSLTMALREKETLAEKVDVLNKQIKILTVDINEEKSSIAAENNILKLRIEELSELESKNELLVAEMVGLKSRCDFLESERERLLKTINEKEEVILSQCKKNAESERLLKTELEKNKTNYESIRKVQLHNIHAAKEGLNKIINIIEQM